MPQVIGATTNAPKTANPPLDKHAAPAGETLRKATNVPGGLATLADKNTEQPKAPELLTKTSLPQEPSQLMLREQLNNGTDGVLKALQSILEHEHMRGKVRSHSWARDILKIPSQARLPELPPLPNRESYSPLLHQFEKYEQQFGDTAYACPGGPALQNTKTLLQAMSDHAQAMHDFEDLFIRLPHHQQGAEHDPLANARSQVNDTAQAVFAALMDDTLPAGLRQTTASLFSISDYHKLPSDPPSQLLRSIVKPMTPEEAAVFFGKLPREILIRSVIPETESMLDEFLPIAIAHPQAERRASLLARLVVELRSIHGDSWKERLPDTLRILAHLPDKHEGRLSLSDALVCLKVFQNVPRAPDNEKRDNRAQAAALRIVECTEPLPKDAAKGMQDWIRLNLWQQTYVNQLASLVPLKEAR